MSLVPVNPQMVARKPLGQNNSQTHRIVKKEGKVTAKADSTGLENDKKMLIKHHHSVKKPQTPSVAKRNLRERTRVRGVNDGFGKLKLYVPNMKSKSSKVETLRGAIDYIKRLKELLGEEIGDTSSMSIKFEDDDIKDDSSVFSDMTDHDSFDQSPNSQDGNLHSMVYQLPTRSPFQIESSEPLLHSPILLPPVYSLSPSHERLLIPASSLHNSGPSETKPLDRLPPLDSLRREKFLEKLPSMSITAPSWWPEK